jgi:hypothetical protein
MDIKFLLTYFGYCRSFVFMTASNDSRCFHVVVSHMCTSVELLLLDKLCYRKIIVFTKYYITYRHLPPREHE